MIKYTLQCDSGHQFDGWFGSSRAYDEQHQAGFVTCPFCDSDQIEKTLMAPAVTGTKKQKTVSEIPAVSEQLQPAPDATAPAAQELVQGDATVQAVVEKMRELRKWVEANTDNVGNKFADEARKIHYGEEDARGIFGSATAEEAKELVEEGVEFLPLPSLPEEKN